MTQEEKARAYDKALNIAREILDHTSENYLCTHLTKEDIKNMYIRFFPELKESEDERIRKGLIKAVSRIFEGNKLFDTDVTREEALAWLEKVITPNHNDIDSSFIEDIKNVINEAPLLMQSDKEKMIAWLEKQGEVVDINPSEFDLRLNQLLMQFESLPKEELASSLSFYLNIVQNDGTYKEEKQGEVESDEDDIESEERDIREALNKIWLEKQGETYTKRDVDDAWLKGMCDAKRELEKQSEQKPADNDKLEDEEIINSLINFVTHPVSLLLPDKKREYISFLEGIKENGRRINFSKKIKSEKQVVLITETNGDANIDWDTRSLQDARKLLERGLQYINTELEKQGEQDMIPLNKVIKFLDEQLVNDKDEVTGEPFINFQNYGAFKETFISYFKRKMLEKQGEQKPIIEMKSPEESLGISSKEYNDIVNDCLYGEEKPTEKVEPKFHEGDWIVFNGLTLYVKEVVKGFYRTISKGGIPNSYDGDIDNAARLWTIQDARDGDVLASDNKNCPFIYRTKTVFGSPVAYCGVRSDGLFISESPKDHQWCLKSEVQPAPKEQRDLLFQKMKEAGYEWDAEKKELKKIEQKPSWSEEDERNLNDAILFIETGTYSLDKDNLINWLKSLRPQNRDTYNPYKEVVSSIAEMCDKYKSFSDDRANDFVNNVKVKCKDAKEYDSLYNDLKKLTE